MTTKTKSNRKNKGQGVASNEPDKLLLSKNPFHLLVGKWLAEQRRVRTVSGSTSEAAQALGLTGRNGTAFVRAVESGASPLPADKALALSTFTKISFTSAAELVTLVRHLDCPVRVKTPTSSKLGIRMTDHGDLLLKAQQLRPTLPHYANILDWLIRWLSGIDSEQSARLSTEKLPIEAQAQAALLDQTLRQANQQFELPGTKQQNPSSLEAKLSPMIADILHDTVEKLSLFSPHINYASLEKWERQNTHRMINQWGYISNPNNIDDSFSSAFDWNFLLNKYRPYFTLIVPSAYQHRIEEWNKTVQKSILLFFRSNYDASSLQLPKSIEDAAKHVSVVSLPRGQDGEDFVQLLDFDFRTRNLLIDVNEEEREFLLKKGYARTFNNAWIYELANNDGHSTFIGILDDFDYHDPQPHFFSMALRPEDVERWRLKLGLGARS